jgi:hypothetical protein
VATRPGSACTTGGGYTIHEDMSRSKFSPNLQHQVHRRERRERNGSIRLVGLPVFVFCDHELLEETLDQRRTDAVYEGRRSA